MRKQILVCRPLSFFCLLNFCITSSYVTLLLIVNPNSTLIDFGTTIKALPVTDNVTDVDVVAITIIVSKISIL